jgi:hypothetical protein
VVSRTIHGHLPGWWLQRKEKWGGAAPDLCTERLRPSTCSPSIFFCSMQHAVHWHAIGATQSEHLVLPAAWLTCSMLASLESSKQCCIGCAETITQACHNHSQSHELLKLVKLHLAEKAATFSRAGIATLGRVRHCSSSSRKVSGLTPTEVFCPSHSQKPH